MCVYLWDNVADWLAGHTDQHIRDIEAEIGDTIVGPVTARTVHKMPGTDQAWIKIIVKGNATGGFLTWRMTVNMWSPTNSQ